MKYLFIMIGLFFISPVNAICKWSDSQGQIHYSQSPPPGVVCATLSIDSSASTSAAAQDKDKDSNGNGNGNGLRPGEQALLQQIEQREQARGIEREKARKRQRKRAARLAALAAENRKKCEKLQHRLDSIREQRRQGYALSQARILDQQMADTEQGMRTYCR
jgi:hypothetical protein